MRILIVAALLALAAALPAAAQDKAKPNTLTPKEIADGWILLFDGETTFGATDLDGVARVADDLLILGGNGKTTRFGIDTGFLDYEISFEHRKQGRDLGKK